MVTENWRVSGMSCRERRCWRSSALNACRSCSGQLSEVALVFSTPMMVSAGRVVRCTHASWTSGPNSPLAANAWASPARVAQAPVTPARAAHMASSAVPSGSP